MDYSKVQLDPRLVKGAHKCMMAILKEIDRVCTKHDIKWWIEDGTLLGAVRHQGFIPWDDDCDIGMMREDYEKFVKVARFDMDEKFVFQARGIDPLYSRRLPKVRMKGTKLVEHDEDLHEKYFQGIFVDIFVWDYFYGWEKFINQFLNIMPRIRSKRTEYPKHSLKRILHGVMTAAPYAISRSLELCYLGLRLLIRKNNSLPYVGYEAQQQNGLFYIKEVIFPLGRRYLFEGELFPSPNDTDKFLVQNYGAYMRLPPLKDRCTHSRLIEVPEEYLD